MGLALAIGLIYRVQMLSEALWYDEVVTLWFSGEPLKTMLAAAAGDVHPPLWYVVTYVSVRWFGDNALAVRLPALLLALASFPLAWSVFDWLWLNRPIRLLALSLMALSPFLAYYSAEARMYSLLLFLVLLATMAALRGNWSLLGLAVGLGLITHYLFVIYLPVIIYLYTRHDEANLYHAAIPAGLVALPWLPIAWAQFAAVKADYWILPLTPGRTVYTLHQVLVGSWLDESAILPVGLVALGLLTIGSLAAWKHHHHVLLALAWSPFVVVLALSWVIRPVLIPRVLIGSAPFLLAIIAMGAYWLYTELTGRWTWLLAVVPLLALVAMPFPIRPDYPAIYRQINIRPGETCYHLLPGGVIMGRTYMPQCEHVRALAWPTRPNGLSQQTVTALGLNPRPTVAGGDWLFFDYGPYTRQAELNRLNQILKNYPGSEQTILMERPAYTSIVWRLE